MDARFQSIQEPKRQKLGNGGSNSLSDLPDVLIERILSLLPTKDAIRWEYLWTSLPTLKFNHWMFDKRSPLVNAVERALTLRGPADIKEFDLSLRVLGDASRINSWITAVVRRNVECLSLELPSLKEPFLLPHSLFTSATLKELILDFAGILRVPRTICFSSLRNLSLSSVVFSDEYTVQQ